MNVDLRVDAHLPHEYIGVEGLRLEMYRKLASARDTAALDEVAVEMRDRCGEPPASVATSSPWRGSGCWRGTSRGWPTSLSPRLSCPVGPK